MIMQFTDTVCMNCSMYVFAIHNVYGVRDVVASVCGDEFTDYILSTCDSLKYKECKTYNVYFNGSPKCIIIVGAGDACKLNRASIEKLGGSIYSIITSNIANVEDGGANVFISNDISFNNAASYLASGMALKSYVFDKYKSNKSNINLRSIKLLTSEANSDEQLYSALSNISNAVHFVRSLVNEPANVINPQAIVDQVSQQLSSINVAVKILDKNDMSSCGMNALLGVAQGSDAPPYTLICEYISDSSMQQIAFVGKGVTFDSGGISIKPSNNMAEMKGDMAGAAVVLGTIMALASNKIKCNVIAAVGLVENMPSGTAQRPGDIVTTMNGTTIEVDNTDAEGRLVLADVLCYIAKHYSPSTIIDVATLTGAIGVALGREYAGLFSNSDILCNDLLQSSVNTGEKIWRLPTHDSYSKDIESSVADIKNVGSGNGGGSITAAKFLEHFIPKTTQWAHIDIAYTEWCKSDLSLSYKGATGFGVRLLYDYTLSRSA